MFLFYKQLNKQLCLCFKWNRQIILVVIWPIVTTVIKINFHSIIISHFENSCTILNWTLSGVRHFSRIKSDNIENYYISYRNFFFSNFAIYCKLFIQFSDSAYQTKLEAAKNLLAMNFPIQNIVKATGLSIKEVEAL